jgi:hypothetical protein
MGANQPRPKLAEGRSAALGDRYVEADIFAGIVLRRLSTPLRIFTKVRKNRIFAAAKSPRYASNFF